MSDEADRIRERMLDVVRMKRRLEQAEWLIGRAVKFAAEDKPTTPGSTRLTRLIEKFRDFLAPAVPLEPPAVCGTCGGRRLINTHLANVMTTVCPACARPPAIERWKVDNTFIALDLAVGRARPPTTAPPCPTWCGESFKTGDYPRAAWWSEGSRAWSTPACRDAGKCLNPTPGPTKP